MKRLLAVALLLGLVAAACGGASDEETTTTPAPAAVETTQPPAPAPTAGTLAEVRARGSLRCGVSTGAIGFSEPQEDGSYNGFDADFCRALAAVV